MPARGQRGQIVPLVALTLVAAAVAIWGMTLLGRSAIDQARAQTAADAAALAGAVGDQSSAEQLASANAATLVSFERIGPDVRVVVQVGRMRARARARRSGGG